ncbi:MAG: hypothetical protein JRH18_00105 [Deltaproteobacteria bacterium]|nr:hypothetical protein [Deltaproteobacteria bacterium]MBW1995919.1 hypothetical protein [Deltaproteobacteria bacterium]MBW2150049.1 hypothetical protein [Deltaproteobacteria bacterium]
MNKQMIQKPIAVVLGLGQNGLATVRALARRGVPVVGIDRDLRQYTARTRYCKRLHCPDFKEGALWIRRLVQLGRALPCKGVLFPSGDFSLQMLSDHRELLDPYFHFTFPAKDVVDLCLDKKVFYRFAAEQGFPIPQSFFPESDDDWRMIAANARYPCIVKPYQPSLGWRRLFPDQKLFEIGSADELLKLSRRIRQVHSDLIVQEWIPGKDDLLFFSLTYLDSTSTPLGMFTGRKIRQQPPRSGTSSIVESRWHQWIADTSTALLQAMNYTGYGSVEFKWDRRDQTFKIIEVSARTWFPHGIGAACGVNLEYLAYCDTTGLQVPPVNRFRQGVKWIHEERDLHSCMAYLKAGQLTIPQWISSYRGARTYAIACWDDPGPMLFLMLHLITVPLRRFRRRFAGSNNEPRTLNTDPSKTVDTRHVSTL